MEKKLPMVRQRVKENSRLLPQQAVDLMTAWYDKHYSNPYPSFRDTEQLARDGCITVGQVKQWFVNVRRRTHNQFRMKRQPSMAPTLPQPAPCRSQKRTSSHDSPSFDDSSYSSHSCHQPTPTQSPTDIKRVKRESSDFDTSVHFTTPQAPPTVDNKYSRMFSESSISPVVNNSFAYGDSSSSSSSLGSYRSTSKNEMPWQNVWAHPSRPYYASSSTSTPLDTCDCQSSDCSSSHSAYSYASSSTASSPASAHSWSSYHHPQARIPLPCSPYLSPLSNFSNSAPSTSPSPSPSSSASYCQSQFAASFSTFSPVSSLSFASPSQPQSYLLAKPANPYSYTLANNNTQQLF